MAVMVEVSTIGCGPVSLGSIPVTAPRGKNQYMRGVILPKLDNLLIRFVYWMGCKWRSEDSLVEFSLRIG